MVLLKELHVGGATICMVTHDERFAGTLNAQCICLMAKSWRTDWQPE
jgi:ABC-type ATPase involved in cell division